MAGNPVEWQAMSETQNGGNVMERLTKRDTDGQAMMDCEKCEADWTGKHGKPMADCTALYCRNRLKERLADYEDTWLTPEEIDMDHEAAEQLRNLCRNCDLDRLEKLAEADGDGRLVVLPCLETVDGNSPEECYIYCPECDFESGVYSKPKFIVEKWNRRATMAEPKKPFYRDKKWKLGGSFGWWHIPYCPHCKRQLGLMVEEQKAEKCPMCGKPLEWDGAYNG